MKSNLRNIILVVTFILVIIGVAQNLHQNSIKGQILTSTKQNLSPTINPYLTWASYKNIESRYTLKVPTTWKIEEQGESESYQTRTLFTPHDNTQKIANIIETSVTVISKPQLGQSLTTQKEFDAWYKKNTRTEETGRIQKLDNTTVDGQQAVILIDTGSGNEWSLATWVRKGEMNVYINAKGDKKLSQADTQTYKYLISTLKFFK